jgi:hypothetical protein
MPLASHLSLGGLDFLFSSAEIPFRLDTDEPYRSFLRPGCESRVIHVQFTVSSVPSFVGEAIFHSDATWSILARESVRAVVFRHPSGETLYVATFRPGSPEVTVCCSPRLTETEGSTTVLRSPFRYPLDQVLTMYLLGGTGVVLHAAGVLVGERGIALAGVSGAGKSTFMGLAAGRPGWKPLSDDRVIIRVSGDSAAVHGTPWPGESRLAENSSGALACLLFLEQGGVNEIQPLRPRDAVARLLRTASVPWYDPGYLGDALDACGTLVRSVPCAVLTFRPEVGAIEAVERFLSNVDCHHPA